MTEKVMSVIEKWKNDDTVVRFKEGADCYGIRVIGRGDNLFFQENENALICDIDAVDAIIYARSIKNWDGQKKMQKSEKERVLSLIEKYYKNYINENVTVSH